jgi:hypothetical protein
MNENNETIMVIIFVWVKRVRLLSVIPFLSSRFRTILLDF